jgi:cyclohexa-1,5-dienecarbonyl-CoA hydratase
VSADVAIRVEHLADGHVVFVRLAAGKGNVLSLEVLGELDACWRALSEAPHVHAVVLGAAGPDFSFGASVAEHRPDLVRRMLPAFHTLFRTIAAAAVPTIAAVRGRCFGGGLELALAAQHIVVADDASLGVPEITLGVFPPVAAAVLPFRVRQPVADRLITLGEVVSGREAVALGLADQSVPADGVERAALAIAERYVALSGSSLRFATRAARAGWNDALDDRLTSLEQLYLGELTKTHDGCEGIEAFLGKRKPVWTDA